MRSRILYLLLIQLDLVILDSMVSLRLLQLQIEKSFSVGLSTNPGLFDNNINLRTVDLPRFERKEFNTTLFVYRKEEIQEYIPNAKDGVYHLTLIAADSQPQVAPFQNLRYSQPLKNLYPQLDRDNQSLTLNRQELLLYQHHLV